MLEDKKLIKSTINGNTGAFRMLVNRYNGYVYSIAFSILKHKEDAEEATQDTFVKVFKNIATYKADAKFQSWIYSIAYRTSLDKYRAKKRHISTDLPEGFDYADDPDKVPVSLSERKDLRKWLNIVIDGLPGEEASLLRMFYFEEMTIKEMKDITGLSESNIKIKLFRSRKTLSKKLRTVLKEELNTVYND